MKIKRKKLVTFFLGSLFFISVFFTPYAKTTLSNRSLLKNFALNTVANTSGMFTGIIALTCLCTCMFASNEYLQEMGNNPNRSNATPIPPEVQRSIFAFMGLTFGVISTYSFYAAWFLLKNATMAANEEN